MPLSRQGPHRSLRQNVALAVLLAGVAGAVNAAGFFVLGAHTSHMTGNVAQVGEALSTGRWDIARLAAAWICAFVLGAATAAALMEWVKHRPRGRHVPALALEALILVSVTAFVVLHPDEARHHAALVGAMAFAMGMQNALVTRISGAVIRTTHLTGVLTDLGIDAVQAAQWLRHRWRTQGGRGLFSALRQARSFEALWLHLALLGSFAVGATLGPLLLLWWGPGALAIPAISLTALIFLDLRPSRPPRAPASA